MATVRSKIHRAMELVAADEVFLPATSEFQIFAHDDSYRAQHWDKYKPDKQYLKDWLITISHLPCFVIDDSLRKMLVGRSDSINRSLLELKEAGLLALPFEQQVIEFDYVTRNGSTVRPIVAMTDLHVARERILSQTPDPSMREIIADEKFDCAAELVIVEKDQHGEYLVWVPLVMFMGVVRGENDEPWIRTVSWRLDGAFANDKEVEALVKQIKRRFFHTVFHALVSASLLYYTQGIEKEVVDCERLNKARKKKGAPDIPAHTYIYIGRVYRSAKSDDSASERFDVRKSPIPHWRRAHVRSVRYGQGRKQVKFVRIEARMVAWDGKGPEPSLPERTYVVKHAGKEDPARV